MTLTEKVSQLVHGSVGIERLGIKKYNWWNECLHGVARAGLATVFPQTIGLAATWNVALIADIAIAISDEARAKHHEYDRQGKNEIYQGLTYWSPNINIFRDPRWGRGMETFGEDPYLTSLLAVAFIKGLQGNHPEYFKLIATPKHFAVHSGPEESRHTFNAEPSYTDLWETYLPAFEACIKEGKAYSIMGAYNRLNGEACTASKFLLTEVLRKKWGFEGYVVSDAGAITDIADYHKITDTLSQAAALAVKNGTDLCAGTEYLHLQQAVNEGLIAEAELDTSLRRLLEAKRRLGLLNNEDENPYSKIPYSVVDCSLHKKLALQAARESIVLLQNDDNILPLQKTHKTIAVIGPNGNDADIHLGNYHGTPSSLVSLFEGIKNKVGHVTDVVFEQGCELAGGLPLLTILSEKDIYTDESKTKGGFTVKYYNDHSFGDAAIFVQQVSELNFKLFDNLAKIVESEEKFGISVSGCFVPQETGEYALGVHGLTSFELFVDRVLLTSFDTIWEPEKVYGLIHLEKGISYKIDLRIKAKTSEAHVQKLLWAKPDLDMKKRALAVASTADVVVLAMGLSPQLEGEEMPVLVPGFNKGDRSDLDLPQSQQSLIKEIVALGKPTVLVLFNGCALSVNWEKANISAIVEAWYGGQSAGDAVADVLFGDYNPSGRLPITFYKSVAQLPAFDDYSMKNRTYKYFKDEVLFEFGHGLSYSTFNYSSLRVVAQADKNSFLVSVDVENTSQIVGEEVVQLYLSRLNPTEKHPLRTLQGFHKIHLEPGEQKNVEFMLCNKHFSIIQENEIRGVEDGAFEITVGRSVRGNGSDNIESALTSVVETFSDLT